MLLSYMLCVPVLYNSGNQNADCDYCRVSCVLGAQADHSCYEEIRGGGTLHTDFVQPHCKCIFRAMSNKIVNYPKSDENIHYNNKINYIV